VLVLTRRQGEDILFPELDIVVRVIKVRGKSISIGIDAPEEIRIARGELAPLSKETLLPKVKPQLARVAC
jgi:carbon storage regulator